MRDAFGTVRYSSPEMANDTGIGQKTDIWSAGVVMYFMLSGAAPFLKSSDSGCLMLCFFCVLCVLCAVVCLLLLCKVSVSLKVARCLLYAAPVPVGSLQC